MKSYLLAVETSCDDTSVALLDREGEVVSNVVSGQVRAHAPFGGVVPEIASREHLANISAVFGRTLEESGASARDLGAVASTRGPGLLGSVLVGFSFSKSLAWSLGIPYYGVNHIEAHLSSPWIEKRDLPFPSLVLVVSGGHSHIFHARDRESFELVSATRDDAAGEAFDKAGKKLRLPYPQGPVVDRMARKGDPGAFKFPSPRMKEGLDLSFSGLKTAFVHTLEKEGLSLERFDEAEAPKWVHDIFASFEKAVVDHLMDRLGSCVMSLRPASVAMAGGVAANTLLRERFSAFAEKHCLPFSIPPMRYCTDNAAMVGFSALPRWLRGAASETSSDAFSTAEWKRVGKREAV